MIFSLTICRVPLDPRGEHILADPVLVNVSTLSFIDLSWANVSKLTPLLRKPLKTKSEKLKLRDSFMRSESISALHNCIESLRTNQMQLAPLQVPVPYRDSRLTQLLRAFFENPSRIVILLCVDRYITHGKDLQRLKQILEFGALASEVSTPLPMPTLPIEGCARGRGIKARLGAIKKSRTQKRAPPAIPHSHRSISELTSSYISNQGSGNTSDSENSKGKNPASECIKRDTATSSHA